MAYRVRKIFENRNMIKKKMVSRREKRNVRKVGDPPFEMADLDRHVGPARLCLVTWTRAQTSAI